MSILILNTSTRLHNCRGHQMHRIKWGAVFVLGIITPGEFSHWSSHCKSYHVLLHLAITSAKSNSSSVAGIRLDYSCSIWPGGKNMQNAYRCVSRLYLHNPQRYWMNSSLVLNEWLICTEWLAHLYWMSNPCYISEEITPAITDAGHHTPNIPDGEKGD